MPKNTSKSASAGKKPSLGQKAVVGLLVIAVGLLVLSFLYPRSATAPTPQNSDYSGIQENKRSLGTFSGTLPCADCSGLKTTLTLYEDSDTLGAAGYSLTEEYVGKTKPMTTTGKWDYVRGTNVDPDTVVYLLNPDSKTSKQYYQRVDSTTLKTLDVDGNPYDAPFNLNLTRVK